MLANCTDRHDRRSTSRKWKRCAASTPAGRTALAFIEYAIGKEYEDLEQWNDAFAAFARGAAAKRATVDYDEAADAAAFDAIMRDVHAAVVRGEPRWLRRRVADLRRRPSAHRHDAGGAHHIEPLASAFGGGGAAVPRCRYGA